MTRKLRHWYRGAIYHIYARGNRRSPIFLSREDYFCYLEMLMKIRSTYPFILHSYCLMTTHIHLLIETIDHPISLIMKEVHSRYAVYFNKKYGYEGHVFQGRFGSKEIDSPRYFLDASRYIHRNPLEANMIYELSSYEWSSYPAYLNLLKNPTVDLQRTLNYFPDPKIEHYQRFVEKIQPMEEENDGWLLK